jgi:hypothetical protein
MGRSQKISFIEGREEMNEQMSVITLWQPWASWVIWGWKTIETRLHGRFEGLAGKWIGIHAAQHWDESAIDSARQYLSWEQLEKNVQAKMDMGKLLSIVHVARAEWLPMKSEYSRRALIDCEHFYRFGLIIDHAEPWKPTPMKGKQGIWYFSPASQSRTEQSGNTQTTNKKGITQ